jgi:hypothetical protein
MALKHDVQSGAMNLKDKLFIEMQPDQRHGLVRYGNDMFHSKVSLHILKMEVFLSSFGALFCHIIQGFDSVGFE